MKPVSIPAHFLLTDIMQCLCNVYHIPEKRVVALKSCTGTILCRHSGKPFLLPLFRILCLFFFVQVGKTVSVKFLSL